MDTTVSRVDWERQPTDPDLSRDLGYEMLDWEVIRAEQGARTMYLFLPEDKEMLADDAFIVAETRAVCQLDGMC